MRRQREGETDTEREKVELSPRGVVLMLSLTGGCHGEEAVPNSGTSNGRRRCLCHHGDGAVPREVVMGWQVRDNRSSLQACTPKARVAACRPTAKPEKSKFYLWGRKPRLWGKFLSGQGQSHAELQQGRAHSATLSGRSAQPSPNLGKLAASFNWRNIVCLHCFAVIRQNRVRIFTRTLCAVTG